MKEQLEEYFTEHERSNIGLVIKTRFGYVDHSYLDDLWDLGYYATWIARNTYDEEKGRKYSTYQYQLVFNEIYKFVIGNQEDDSIITPMPLKAFSFDYGIDCNANITASDYNKIRLL